MPVVRIIGELPIFRLSGFPHTLDTCAMLEVK